MTRRNSLTRLTLPRTGLWLAGAGIAALALAGCAVELEPSASSTSATVLGASCTLGDGFVIASGGHKSLYPVTCPSDCNDFPNGGFEYVVFCLNGTLGEDDPALTGGSVGPAIPASQYNGNIRCTAKPNPYSTPHWGQSADRRTCVRL